jgi:mono/diheme cytochrome c family protein
VSFFAFLLLTFSFSLPGCRRDMQDQPKMKPYRASSFFRDGLSSRPLLEGTVPRGWLRADTEFFTGKKNQTQGANATGVQLAGAGPASTTATAAATQSAAVYPDDIDKFPFPVNEDVLTRGQVRYQVFCSVCHGMTGYGDGMIVRRGFRKPPSLHEERLRQAPVGHFFDVTTNGWGAMPSYAAQIPAPDRWAIIAYVRALQLSQPVAPSAPPQTSQTTPAAATPTPATKSGGKQ